MHSDASPVLYAALKTACGAPADEPTVRRLLWLIANRPGRMGSADDTARALGLRSRFALARLLRYHSLPPLTELRGGGLVLAWILEREKTGRTLAGQVLHDGRDTSWAYHLVQRHTGKRWSDVSGYSLAEVARLLRRRWAREERRAAASGEG